MLSSFGWRQKVIKKSPPQSPFIKKINNKNTGYFPISPQSEENIKNDNKR